MESLSNLPQIVERVTIRAGIRPQAAAPGCEPFSAAQLLGPFPNLDPSQAEGPCRAHRGPSSPATSILLCGPDLALPFADHTIQLLLQVQSFGLAFHSAPVDKGCLITTGFAQQLPGAVSPFTYSYT